MLIVLALLAGLLPPTASPAGFAATDGALAGPIVIRKLHLVRPDLIPYPVVYDVVC